MKLTILGKYGPYPKKGGATSGYLLQAGDTKILLDCGSGIISRVQEHCELKEIDAIILTHLHSDHMADVFVLRYALAAMGRAPLTVFTPTNPHTEYEILKNSGVFELIPVHDGLKLKLNGLELEFWEMTHPVPSYGVKISDGETVFAYSGDTNLNDRIVEFASGAQNLLVDTGLLAEQKSSNTVPHLTAREVGEIGAALSGTKVICTHISPVHDEEKVLAEVRESCPDAIIAQEGNTYEV